MTPERPQSLRRRLLVTILGLVAPLSIALSAVLFLAVHHTVWARFDEDLIDFAGTLVELVEVEGDEIDFELGARPAPPSRGHGHATHYWLWDSEGELVVSTLEVDKSELPAPELEAPSGMRLHAVALPDGSAARVVELRFVPAIDEEFVSPEPPGLVTLVVAKQTESTGTTLFRIGTWFAGLGLITLGAASFAAWWAVRRGLEPVGSLGAALAIIEPEDLSTRLEPGAVPVELRPVVLHANGLLDRLQLAFEKERRFTADVAHELRTPLSVLRTEIELALRRERTNIEYRETLEGAKRTAEDLGRLVEHLLRLARADAGDVQIERRELVLAHEIEGLWANHASLADERALRFESRIDPNSRITTDPEELRIIVGNLLSNAARYTARGGWVRVDQEGEGTILRVLDSGPVVPHEQRERLFDRFWRADAARSEAGVHFGVGLALVRSSCERLGFEVAAEEHEGAMAFVVRRRT